MSADAVMAQLRRVPSCAFITVRAVEPLVALIDSLRDDLAQVNQRADSQSAIIDNLGAVIAGLTIATEPVLCGHASPDEWHAAKHLLSDVMTRFGIEMPT